jgi:hypothetical protein
VRHRLTLGQFAPDNLTPEQLLDRALHRAWRLRRHLSPPLGIARGVQTVAHGNVVVRRLARAGDAPDFSSLEARVRETQGEVRGVFDKVVEG